MKVIKISGAENKTVPYLFNRVMPIAGRYGAGAKYLLKEGDVTVKVANKSLMNKMKQALSELYIKFTEGEE
jgi:hypothetical protein